MDKRTVTVLVTTRPFPFVHQRIDESSGFARGLKFADCRNWTNVTRIVHIIR